MNIVYIEYLNKEIIERDKLHKTFKRFATITTYVDHTLLASSIIATGAAITSLATGIGSPLAIGFGALGLETTIGQGVVQRTGKVYSKKAKKHNDVCIAAQTILDGISISISKSIQYDNISSEEFQRIIQERQRYLASKQQIPLKTKRVITSINDEQRQAILDQGRKEGKQDFLRQIGATSDTQPVNVT